MAEIEIETGLRENTVGALEQFADIAATDPLVAAMLITGAIITGFSVGLFGIVTLGAVIGTIRRGLESSEVQPH